MYYIYTLRDSIIYKYNLVLGILGGAKKRKAEEPARIPDVLGKVAIVATDTTQISTVLNKEHFNMEDMIAGLNLGQLVALDGSIDKYEKHLASDTAIRCYSDFDSDLKQIQEHICNITLHTFKCHF